MGQPIVLKKGKDTMTVYGTAQAAVHFAEGWQPEDASIVLPVAPPQPVKVEPLELAEPVELGVNATDAAIALALSNGIVLGAVKGTGADGRITVGDVKALITDGD